MARGRHAREPVPEEEEKKQPQQALHLEDEDDEDEDEDVEAAALRQLQKPFLIRYITAFSRIAGAILLCTLWLFTVLLLNQLSYYKYSAWYLLGISLLTTFVEPLWLINKCVISCIRADDCCCRFWHFLIWIDIWRKTILYVAFAIPCFLQDIITTETTIAGLLLITTAVLYFIKSFKESTCVHRKGTRHAVVQTTPNTKLVPHGVQLGAQSPPPHYHATHTLPSTVQPHDRHYPPGGSTAAATTTAASSSERSAGSFLDPGGRKLQRYSEKDGSPRSRGRAKPSWQGDNDNDSGDGGGGGGDDVAGVSPRSKKRQRADRANDSERYRRDNRDRIGDDDGVDDDYVDGHRNDDKDAYKKRRRYPDEESDRRSPRSDDRDRPPAGHRKDAGQTSPKPNKPSPKLPVKEKPVPPLKELPPQASEALKTSAAASLVKQVSSGSIVLTTMGSTPSGMPGKVEQRVTNMKNPLAGTNPFDEPDNDEYFD